MRQCDVEEFDLILAMDRGHLRALERMAAPAHRHKLWLFVPGRDVPDPYYGGPEGFEQVLRPGRGRLPQPGPRAEER